MKNRLISVKIILHKLTELLCIAHVYGVQKNDYKIVRLDAIISKSSAFKNHLNF